MTPSRHQRRIRRLKAAVALTAIAAQLAAAAAPAIAFCGFYVAKADSKLFNKSSKVVLAWDAGKTSVTMASDYDGDPAEFALVVPVPTFIERDQISVAEMKTIDHLDAFTAPRLAEYFDPDPCLWPNQAALASTLLRSDAALPAAPAPAKAAGVTVEATYAVGEYDISILSAKQSDGLVVWLKDNGYRLSAGAAPVLGSYIRQGMHFFVAKVNLGRLKTAGARYLRPIQVRYETKKFMLPLRLGTVNANGPQDMIVMALTRRGRVEAANYITAKVPSGMTVPLFVRDSFGPFYKAMFERAVERENRQAVFLEYAWDMAWCDPCAAEPLDNAELAGLGARWASADKSNAQMPQPGAGTYVTRLHVRYDAAHFPEDLMFIETHDRQNFQGRYVMQHPWTGDMSCPNGERYSASLPLRFEGEARTLADLTGWPIEEIRARMERSGQSFTANP